MRGAFRIGRLFGIDIAIDWSWGLIFLLMSWNLTTVFRHWHPTWSFGSTVFFAVTAALLFFGSVLAHELAHSLVARSFGVRVHEIRLFLFGGVSNMEGEPPSAAAEFWTAIVGPLMSIALGSAFIVAASFMLPGAVDPASPWDTLARLGPIATLFFWLGPVNVVLGVFNLIPGFPLDGGRILRAALWRATGDLHKATLASSLIGRGVGWTFIVMGIAMFFGARIPFFGQGPGSGIWIAFIGWFLSSAAAQSYQALLLQDALNGVRVAALMRPSGWGVPPETTVTTLVNEWFMRSTERALPVVHNGSFIGLVCIGDIRKVPQSAWSSTSLDTIMTPRQQLVTASPNDDATSALRKLAERNVDQLPVLQGDQLVGMITRSEVARWLELHVNGGPAAGHFGARRATP